MLLGFIELHISSRNYPSHFCQVKNGYELSPKSHKYNIRYLLSLCLKIICLIHILFGIYTLLCACQL